MSKASGQYTFKNINNALKNLFSELTQQLHMQHGLNESYK